MHGSPRRRAGPPSGLDRRTPAPWHENELRSLAERLEGDPVDALIRRDKTYQDLGLEADGWGVDHVVATLLEHPSLLQRPSSTTAPTR